MLITRTPAPLLLVAVLVVVALTAAPGCDTRVACNDDDDCPTALPVCEQSVCRIAGGGEGEEGEGEEGEGEGEAGEGEGEEGEGEGEGEGEPGCVATPDLCIAGQYCVDVANDLARGSCVPAADTVTICETTTGSYPAPNREAPALFEARLLADSGASFCDNDVELRGLTLSARYYDVEGDFDGTDPGAIQIYREGAIARPRPGTVSDAKTFGAEGFAGTVSFLVCVPVDEPAVAIELADVEGHASNGFCIVR